MNTKSLRKSIFPLLALVAFASLPSTLYADDAGTAKRFHDGRIFAGMMPTWVHSDSLGPFSENEWMLQSRVGFGKGYPWAIPEARDVVYRPEEYPRAAEFIDAALYVFGIGPPNDGALMDQYLDAIAKVLGDVDGLMAVE